MKKQVENRWQKGKEYKIGDIFYTLTFYDGKMFIDKLEVTEIGGYDESLGRHFILHNIRAKADMEAGRSREGWLHHSAEWFIGHRIYETPIECFQDIEAMIQQKFQIITEVLHDFYKCLTEVLTEEKKQPKKTTKKKSTK